MKRINRILLGFVTWMVSMVVVGLIGTALHLPSALYWIAVMVTPILLAVKIVSPKKESVTPSPPQPDIEASSSTESTRQESPTAASSTQKAAEPKNYVPDPYVLNPKTMVIHRRNCKYAKGTYTFDRASTTSRSAALAIGYKPCKFCKP